MRTDFQLRVRVLERHARRDLLVRRGLTGLFCGLAAALLLAVLAGTVRLPFPPALAAAALAAAGLAAGAVSALAARVDRRQLLLRADAALGSREIITTAMELQKKNGGPFAEAIVQDAAELLQRSAPRSLLGPLRLLLAPYATAAALLAAAALLFPVDLRALFLRSAASSQELAQIGEDLRSQGERLAQTARSQDLGRTLELSQELAQLGKDLAARRIQPDDALDRMSDLESGLAQEYQLRMQQVQPAAPLGAPGSGSGTGSPGNRGPNGVEQGKGEATGESGGSADQGLRDLGRALDRLRQAQRDLEGQGGGSDQALAPARPRGQQDRSPAQPGQGLPGGEGPSAPGNQDNGPGGGGHGSTNERPGEAGGAGVGTLPAPQKRGPASEIIQGNQGPGLQAQGDAASQDFTRLLARALPEWTGSRLPDQTILHEYSRQAESALSRDEIPLRLRESVKEYFTDIGVTK